MQIISLSTPKLLIEKRISKAHMAYMHHHHAFELFYIINGEREYFVENRFFKMSEGDLILIPKDQLHRTAGKTASRFLIYFDEDILSQYFTPEIINDLSLNTPFIFRPDNAGKEHLGQLFYSFFNEFNRIRKDNITSPEASPTLAGYLYQILFTMSHGNNIYMNEEYPDSCIGDIIKYINENYNQINDIGEIAERFYISKYHLCHLFSKKVGVSLITYLNTIKIRKACELLKEERLGVTEIATLCGFNSSSYFCKVFKEKKGISPSEYKKQHRINGKK